jgi:hypothetical protein
LVTGLFCFVFLEQAKISKLAAKVVIVHVLGTLHNINGFQDLHNGTVDFDPRTPVYCAL